MIVVLSILLAMPFAVAQASQASALPSATPAPAASPIPVFFAPNEIRRGPATAPRMIRGEAMIRNSGSTNAAGYTIVVRPDLTVDVDVDGSVARKTIGAPQGRWLFAKLREAMPLHALPAGRCMKSVSFGSSTTISYDGTTTPDLSCAGDAVARELSRTIGVISAQLGIVPLRRRTQHEL